jgi:hypothetical protein
MNDSFFLKSDCLPEGFTYPEVFLKIVALSLIDLEPWLILSGEALLSRSNGLRKRYPQRNLIPFARRLDNDDVACWEGAQAGEVKIIHDFASGGWESRAVFPDFEAWFGAAVQDMLNF